MPTPQVAPPLAINKSMTADATSDGVVTVEDTSAFKMSDFVYLQGTGLKPRRCVVKEVTDATSMTLLNEGCKPTDLSAFTVALASTVGKRKA